MARSVIQEQKTVREAEWAYMIKTDGQAQSMSGAIEIALIFISILICALRSSENGTRLDPKKEKRRRHHLLVYKVAQYRTRLYLFSRRYHNVLLSLLGFTSANLASCGANTIFASTAAVALHNVNSSLV